MHKASQIFNEIFNSKFLQLQFLKLKDLKSIFEFLESLDQSITKEEIDEFLCESFQKYFANFHNKLSDNNLEKIAGGAGIYKNKFIATALATLVGFANFSISSYAKDTTDINTTTSSSMVETKNTAQSVKQKISNATKAASEFAKNGYNKTANWDY